MCFLRGFSQVALLLSIGISVVVAVCLKRLRNNKLCNSSDSGVYVCWTRHLILSPWKKRCFGLEQGKGYENSMCTRSPQNLEGCLPGYVVYPKYVFITRLPRTWPHLTTKYVTHYIMTGVKSDKGDSKPVDKHSVRAVSVLSSKLETLLINCTLPRPWLRPAFRELTWKFRSWEIATLGGKLCWSIVLWLLYLGAS